MSVIRVTPATARPGDVILRWRRDGKWEDFYLARRPKITRVADGQVYCEGDANTFKFEGCVGSGELEVERADDYLVTSPADLRVGDQIVELRSTGNGGLTSWDWDRLEAEVVGTPTWGEAGRVYVRHRGANYDVCLCSRRDSHLEFRLTARRVPVVIAHEGVVATPTAHGDRRAEALAGLEALVALTKVAVLAWAGSLTDLDLRVAMLEPHDEPKITPRRPRAVIPAEAWRSTAEKFEDRELSLAELLEI